MRTPRPADDAWGIVYNSGDAGNQEWLNNASGRRKKVVLQTAGWIPTQA